MVKSIFIHTNVCKKTQLLHNTYMYMYNVCAVLYNILFMLATVCVLIQRPPRPVR